MIGQPQKEASFFIFDELEANQNTTQQDLFSRLNIFLGKTNYFLRELMLKGLIKAKNFPVTPDNLINYITILLKKD